MRDRLIDLLLKSEPLHERDLDDDLADGEIEAIADHLLAEGLIVPTCKIGDTIYEAFCGISVEARKVTEIKQSEWGTTYYCSFGWCYPQHLIGKTVFLTREAAEKALERSENGKS